MLWPSIKHTTQNGHVWLGIFGSTEYPFKLLDKQTLSNYYNYLYD